MRRRTGALVAVAAAVALALTGCGPDDERGDPGRVVDREESIWTTRSAGVTTVHYDYDLTIRRPDGTTYELDVSHSGFDRCYRGSSYPKCVDR